MEFAKIAPYLRDPLVLVGFGMFLAFSFSRFLVTKRVIPPLPPKLGFRILRLILLYGFLVGILVCLLGFGLKYREMNEADQRRALSLLSTELHQNYVQATSIAKATVTILEQTKNVSELIRTPKIRLAQILFPRKNLSERAGSLTAAQDTDEAFSSFAEEYARANETEKKQFKQLCVSITGFLERTRVALSSISDREGKRYRFNDSVWTSQLGILNRVTIFDPQDYQVSYTYQSEVRAHFDALVNVCFDYLESVELCLRMTGVEELRSGQRRVLTAERQFMEIVTAYGGELTRFMEQLKSLRDRAESISQHV